MINQQYTGTPTSRRQVTLPAALVATPSLLPAGSPIIVGTEPGVTLDLPQANVNGCTVLFNGSFNLTVYATSADSPQVNSQINPGDNLFAETYTYDATTNVYYNLHINKNISGKAFGRLDPSSPAVPAGTSATAAVQI